MASTATQHWNKLLRFTMLSVCVQYVRPCVDFVTGKRSIFKTACDSQHDFTRNPQSCVVTALKIIVSCKNIFQILDPKRTVQALLFEIIIINIFSYVLFFFFLHFTVARVFFNSGY